MGVLNLQIPNKVTTDNFALLDYQNDYNNLEKSIVGLTETGSVNSYVVAYPNPITSLQIGLPVFFKATHTNTGVSTCTVNSLTATAIKKNMNQDLIAGDIPSGMIIELVYDGTYFQLINSFVDINSQLANITATRDFGEYALTTTQSIPGNIDNTILNVTVTVRANSNFTIVGNAIKVLNTGIHQIISQILPDATTGLYYKILVNGIAVKSNSSGNSISMERHLITLLALNANDLITFAVYNTQAAAININGSAAYTFFQIKKV